MNAQQERVLQSFRRVLGWFGAHPEITPALGDRAAALANQQKSLSEVVDRLSQSAAEQGSQRTQATLLSKDEPKLREELRVHHLGRIARLAQALKGTVPGIGALRGPDARSSTESLVVRATAMAQSAKIYETVLVEHGLPSEFLKELGAAVDALKASIDGRGSARSRSMAATRGLSADLELGKRVVVMMDVAMMTLLKEDPSTAAGWQSAKRVISIGVQSSAVSGSITPLPVAAVHQAA